jgi:hypothetical protein
VLRPVDPMDRPGAEAPPTRRRPSPQSAPGRDRCERSPRRWWTPPAYGRATRRGLSGRDPAARARAMPASRRAQTRSAKPSPRRGSRPRGRGGPGVPRSEFVASRGPCRDSEGGRSCHGDRLRPSLTRSIVQTRFGSAASRWRGRPSRRFARDAGSLNSQGSSAGSPRTRGGADKKVAENAGGRLHPSDPNAQSLSGGSEDLKSDGKGGSIHHRMRVERFREQGTLAIVRLGSLIAGAPRPANEKGADHSEVDGKGNPEHLSF